MEQEKHLEEERMKLEKLELSNTEVETCQSNVRGPPQLAVDGVFFYCPLLGKFMCALLSFNFFFHF